MNVTLVSNASMNGVKITAYLLGFTTEFREISRDHRHSGEGERVNIFSLGNPEMMLV